VADWPAYRPPATGRRRRIGISVRCAGTALLQESWPRRRARSSGAAAVHTPCGRACLPWLCPGCPAVPARAGARRRARVAMPMVLPAAPPGLCAPAAGGQPAQAGRRAARSSRRGAVASDPAFDSVPVLDRVAGFVVVEHRRQTSANGLPKLGSGGGAARGTRRVPRMPRSGRERAHRRVMAQSSTTHRRRKGGTPCSGSSSRAGWGQRCWALCGAQNPRTARCRWRRRGRVQTPPRLPRHRLRVALR
jgi:hypothetical protein